MPELYVLAIVDGRGNITRFVRKGRNQSIAGYDSLASAKRGLAQTNGLMKRYVPSATVRIVEAATLTVIDTEVVR